MRAQLAEQLQTLPGSPGVYLFKDAQGKVIYAGKASNLSKRVKSYFGAAIGLSPKIQQLVLRTNNLDFIVTGSEQEALILELNLIKKYRPQYNVRLKDDKTFPYLKINLNDEWPGVYITRRLKSDGARYFGPFASAGSVRKTLRLVKKVFPFRSCTKPIDGTDKRPCLDYDIHRCPGPCIGAIGRAEDRDIINRVVLFLEGKQELVLHELKDKMQAAALQLQFERAALLRDQIRAIEKIIEGQEIAITLRGEQDVIALVQDGGQACIEILFIRNNKLVGHDYFIMEGVEGEEPSQVMTSFVKQYYASASYIAPLILLQYPVDEMSILSEWLKKRGGGSVKLQVPQRGGKRKLVSMAKENAERGLLLARARQTNLESITSGLQELKERLDLPVLPLRIEGYDISDIQGILAVGSMVVLKRGLPRPNCYRRFRVKTVAGADDYAMMQEILRRRFNRIVSAGDSWANTPDLILIDGGKGQLNAAMEVRRELGIDYIPIASLAKGNEEVFVPGKSEPVDMPKSSPALYILQIARNEAHRFALSYHRRLRYKKGIASTLDDISGIGPKKKRTLLKKFGSIELIRNASAEEISQADGITLTLAEKIKEYL